MPILQNRAYEVLQKIVEHENDRAELCQTVQASMRSSARHAFFVLMLSLNLTKNVSKIRFWNHSRRGRVVAVDYCTEKVTVDCTSILEYSNEKETFFELVLDIKDVHVPKDYESKVDKSGSDRGYNSDA